MRVPTEGINMESKSTAEVHRLTPADMGGVHRNHSFQDKKHLA